MIAIIKFDMQVMTEPPPCYPSIENQVESLWITQKFNLSEKQAYI